MAPRHRWSRTHHGSHLTLRPPCHGEDPTDADHTLPWILLDVRAYIADRRNATTACTELNDGHQIQITVCTAPPLLISYICAWSPTTDPALIFAEEPVVGRRCTCARSAPLPCSTAAIVLAAAASTSAVWIIISTFDRGTCTSVSTTSSIAMASGVRRNFFWIRCAILRTESPASSIPRRR
ncbi:hypothetical protein BS78_03G172200 [Paspalum vaginatum]|nr:hypothetical protein BS78_03G172200 [Paspalum vaginatum]